MGLGIGVSLSQVANPLQIPQRPVLSLPDPALHHQAHHGVTDRRARVAPVLPRALAASRDPSWKPGPAARAALALPAP